MPEIIKRRQALQNLRARLETKMWAESDWLRLGELIRGIKVVDDLIQSTLWAAPR